MNRGQFLKQLSEQLSALPRNERDDILNDYNEYFENGLLEGKSESEIAENLGSPELIAKELNITNTFAQVDQKMTFSNVISAIGLTIGLSFLNLIIVLGPAIAIAGVLFGGWVSSVALIFSPLLQLVSIMLGFNQAFAFEIFLSIGFSGLGIILLIVMYYVTIFSSKVFIRYCKWNVTVVKGGMKHV